MNQLQRKWQPGLTLEDAHKQILSFLIECRKKNVLSEKEPSLYTCYLTDMPTPITLCTPLTEIMTFAKRHGPEMDLLRSSSIRLLSSAIKAHYFMHKEQRVKHEPYLFTTPDLKSSITPRLGLIYPLEHNDILVADWDLKNSASGEVKVKDAYRFPVVLSSDPYKWLTKKRWIDLENKRKYTVGEIYKNKAQVDAITEIDKFTYGKILDYPYEMRQHLYAIGAIFANGIKKWFLLDGWDEEVVIEYLDYVQKHLESNSANEKKF